MCKRTTKALVSLAVWTLILLMPGNVVGEDLVPGDDNFPVVGATYQVEGPITYRAPGVLIEIDGMSLTANDASIPVPLSGVGNEPVFVDSFFDVFTELSVDGGEFWVESFFDVFFDVTVTDVDDRNTGSFQAEIVEMTLVGDIRTSEGVKQVMMRESPTQQSLGQHSITDIGGGLYHIDSFFDVFTELSVDGGQWIPADRPMTLVLSPDPNPHTSPDDGYPPLPGTFKALNPPRFHDLQTPLGPIDIELRVLSMNTSDQTTPTSLNSLSDGEFPVESFFDVFVEMSLDGGASWSVDSFFDVFTELVVDVDTQTTGLFDAEIVSMELSGMMTLPGGPSFPIMMRESPTKPSQGDTKLTQLPSGDFAVDSFFDVFTELSVDGGMTWTAAEDRTRLVLTRPLLPYIGLDAAEQWQGALDAGLIGPPPEDFWPRYMATWQNPEYTQGEPYPSNEYREPTLYVWPGGPCPDDPAWPKTAGLVMAWGDAQPAFSTPVSSAWMYSYPTDPDLSNCTVTVTVLPPTGITAISFGMQDISGFIRAWYWNVAAAPGPGTLQVGVPTTIYINTALTGTTAASPTAASYTNDPSFDITLVQDLVFDENAVWVASSPPPPMGTLDPRPWNYWYDLIITPNEDEKVDQPLKWSQEVVEIGPNIFLGWDEVSVRPWVPLLADDWLCKDPRPVTDVHWWGSFIDWNEPELPTTAPTAFHIGIWTDKPVDNDVPGSFSHPRKMIWQHFCTDFKWNFAGYDKDPRKESDDPTATDLDPDVTTFDPTIHDACFQFNCYLPDDKWFYQKPAENGQGRVFWLSIAAIYPAGVEPPHPWGWKTRPHFYNDAAVRIFALADGTWPATVGKVYGMGNPVHFPAGVPWDLAFELTTNEEEPTDPNPDVNLDGVVDLLDLNILTRAWLRRWP